MEGHANMTDWTSLTYVVVDVEGNGQQPPDLVELAVVPIVAGVIEEPRSWLVRPDQPITPFARRIHGITNEQVAEAPVFADIKDEVLAALDVAALVGTTPTLTLASSDANSAAGRRPRPSTRSNWPAGCCPNWTATNSAPWSRCSILPRSCPRA
jgi:hypothetical protein